MVFFFQYVCFVEECHQKFWDSKERIQHCVDVHKYPKDYRYDESRKTDKKNNSKKSKSSNKKQQLDSNLDSGSASGSFVSESSKKSVKKENTRHSGTQHLGSGSRQRGGGTLNWYQKKQPQASKLETSIDMQDLTDSLPSSK